MSEILARVEPLLKLVPGVAKPATKLPFRERFQWTLIILIIFLVASQIPLIGIRSTTRDDPLYWFRTIFASQRGTLMELGTGPMMLSGLLIQVLTGLGVIRTDSKNKKQVSMMNSFEKLLTMGIAIIQAFMYVLLGMYGSVRQLGLIRSLLIIVQLTGMSTIVVLLDELTSKGWAITSGVSLLTATNVCESIFWKTFSIASIKRDKGKEYEGAFIALLYMLLTRKNKIMAIVDAFTRSDLPNLFNVISSIVILALTVFLQNVYYSIPLQHQHTRQPFNYPIKLLYSGTMPVMLLSTVTSYFFMMSQLLYRRIGSNFLVRLIGDWAEVDGFGGQLEAVGGIAYYLSPPSSILSCITHPFHFVIYTAIRCGACAYLSEIWLRYSPNGPGKVVGDIKRNGLIKPGIRAERLKSYVSEPIETAATVSGFVVGLIGVIADLTGAIGGGSGLLISAGTISDVAEKVVSEWME